MSKQLTEKQNKVYLAIKLLTQRLGKSPTLSEIRNYLNGRYNWKIDSLNTIVQYLNALNRAGYIKKQGGKRGINIIKNIKNAVVNIPLYGQADCGRPLSFADDKIEGEIAVSRRYVKGKEEYFFIKASGDSMDKEGINDGDLVLVKKTEEPQESKNVVAVINGLGTIKKFEKINGVPVLLPSSNNKKHQPILLHPDDQIYITGVVKKVFNFSEVNNY